MNKKSSLSQKLCTSPHIVWSAIFIVIPLVMVLYYAFTDANGAFTFANTDRYANFGRVVRDA